MICNQLLQLKLEIKSFSYLKVQPGYHLVKGPIFLPNIMEICLEDYWRKYVCIIYKLKYSLWFPNGLFMCCIMKCYTSGLILLMQEH